MGEGCAWPRQGDPSLVQAKTCVFSSFMIPIRPSAKGQAPRPGSRRARGVPRRPAGAGRVTAARADGRVTVPEGLAPSPGPGPEGSRVAAPEDLAVSPGLGQGDPGRGAARPGVRSSGLERLREAAEWSPTGAGTSDGEDPVSNETLGRREGSGPSKRGQRGYWIQ